MFTAIKHIPHQYLVKGLRKPQKYIRNTITYFIKYLLFDPNLSLGIDFF